METQLPSPKREQSPQFAVHVYCGQTSAWIEMPLGMEVAIGPGQIVLDEDTAPLPQKGRSPQFSANICCGQMAGWIKMPLRREIGLSPSDIVLDDEDPAPLLQKGRIVAKRLDGSRWHLVRR